VGEDGSEGVAETHIQRGLELRRSGDDAGALAEFERAQGLAPSARVRAQIGLALQALGRWRDAEDVELQVLSEESDMWVREHADLLRESVANAQTHLAWLSVTCNVAGAELFVNGNSVGKLPLPSPVRVVAGSNVLQVRADRYASVFRTIDIAGGTRARESFALVELPPPAGPIHAAEARRTDAAAAALSPDPGPARRAAGWVTLVTGGLLSAGGIAAAVVNVSYSGIYNDNSRCFVWPLTRDQRCGVDRGIAEAAGFTAAAALVAGGVGLATGFYLVATSRARSTPSGAWTIGCRVDPWYLGCRGEF
jgi:hypothetical protein